MYTGNYKTDMQQLFDVLLYREKDIIACHAFLGYMHKVIDAARSFRLADTPEQEALARWDMQNAREELDRCMFAWCFSVEERALVRKICVNTK